VDIDLILENAPTCSDCCEPQFFSDATRRTRRRRVRCKFCNRLLCDACHEMHQQDNGNCVLVMGIRYMEEMVSEGAVQLIRWVNQDG
jgi:hypothetical protein